MKKVLFVCSGNTCRSPMAQAVFNHLAQKRGIVYVVASRPDYIPKTGFRMPPIPSRSCRITESRFPERRGRLPMKCLAECDLVFGLTYSLSTALVSAFPERSDKIYRFPLEVPDPFGGDIMLYRRSLVKITEGVERILRAIEAGKL